ncbi:MAG: PAS domain-containing protein [Deltaproteobacteria bacterium]|nr:PAS domain-containing protein [Deltaproteobacteria bacterium]
MRILLVEDEVEPRGAWPALLRSLGHDVVIASNAEHAWQLFQLGGFPLVLVELSARIPATLTLVSRIRSSQRGDRTVVLVAAARDETELIAAAIAAGADDYVRMPVDGALLAVRLSLAERKSLERSQGHQVEEELRRRLERVRAVYHLADAASHARPIEELYAEAIEGTERALHTRRAAILLFDAHGVMRFQAWQGISERYRAVVEGHSPWTREDRDPAPVVVDDAESDDRVAQFRDAIREEGIRSLVFVPIAYRGEVLGKFTIYYGARHRVTDEELLLFQTIANHVAAALARARADERLRASEERFRQLAENIDAVFWIADVAEPRLLYVSPAYERIWGRDVPQLDVEPLAALEAVHPDDRRSVMRMHFHVAKGEMAQAEYRVVRPDGSLRWVRGRAFPVRDERGEVYRVAGITEDVTRVKQLEEQLVQSERLSAAGILVGGIAHQLNNPLTGVLGFAQLLLRNAAVEGKVRSSVERIHAEALRAKQIVGSLLAFARHRRPRLEPIDLNAVLSGTVESALDELNRAGITVETSLSPEVPITTADRLQLRQVFTSLIEHAAATMNGASAADGRRLRISTSLNERDRVEIRIADTGPGVPAELRRTIFDPPVGEAEEAGRSMWGLSMAFAVVQDHQGEIFVTESEPPPGATFVIELPVRADPGPVLSPAI